MKKAVRRLLYVVGAIVGLFVLAAIAIGFFFDLNHYKPEIEAKVASASGMTLKIGGNLSLKLIPSVRIAMRDARLSNRGSELFTAAEMDAAPRLLPFLLHRLLIIDRISLDHPVVHVEKDSSGHMNFESTRTASATPSSSNSPSGGQVHELAVNDGRLTYLDHISKEQTEATGINASFSDLMWGTQIKSVALQGKLRVQSLHASNFFASNLSSNIHLKDGIAQIGPMKANLFGGSANGTTQIDLRGAVPKLEVTQTVSKIALEQIPSAAQGRVSGPIDGTIHFNAAGMDQASLTKSTEGTVSLRGHDIAVTGADIDDLASKLKTAQGLDLVHLGSSILSGPLASTLGQAAGIAGGANESKSVIHDLISNWTISRGVAHAGDVAFSTAKTTIAFKGDINLISKTYQGFDIATVDPKGCSINQLEIGGPLARPMPAAGSLGQQVSRSFLGKAEGDVGSRIGGLFGQKPAQKSAAQACDHFYQGALVQKG